MIIWNGNKMAVKIVSAGVGKAIEVSTAEEMAEILAKAKNEDVGKIYRYIGATTSDYEQGAYYIMNGGE